jgi:hypothetical protein
MSFKHANIVQAYDFITWARAHSGGGPASTRGSGSVCGPLAARGGPGASPLKRQSSGGERGGGGGGGGGGAPLPFPPARLGDDSAEAVVGRTPPRGVAAALLGPYGGAAAIAGAQQGAAPPADQSLICDLESGESGQPAASQESLPAQAPPPRPAPQEVRPGAAEAPAGGDGSGHGAPGPAAAISYIPMGSPSAAGAPSDGAAAVPGAGAASAGAPPLPGSGTGRSGDGGAGGEAQTWLIQEFCDAGTLADAAAEGKLLLEDGSGPDMVRPRREGVCCWGELNLAGSGS